VDDALGRECDAFARYLTGAGPGEYVERKYREAHATAPGLEQAAARFDRALVALARQGPFLARLADAHARVFAPGCLLRRKLVLVLALLEVSAPGRVDAPSVRSAPGLVARAAWAGAVFAFLLTVSTLLLLPVRLVCALAGSEAAG
jgi:hypothetical protein